MSMGIFPEILSHQILVGDNLSRDIGRNPDFACSFLKMPKSNSFPISNRFAIQSSASEAVSLGGARELPKQM